MKTPSPRVARPVRLLMVVDSLEVGGAEQQVVDVAASLQRKGYAVTVACSADGPLSRCLTVEGVPVRCLMRRQVKRRLSGEYAWRLRALLQEGDFDLVHAHLYASSVASALAVLRMPVPLVVTQHSEATWQGPVARPISRWTSRRAARVIAVSEGIRNHVVLEDSVPSDRVVMIPNGINPFTLADEGPADLPAAWSEGQLIGAVARLQPEKGIGVFLEAAAAVTTNMPGCHAVIVGDGPLRGELESRVIELGLQDRVHFLGPRKDARAIIAGLDLLVLPSLSEGTPLVVLEAMAAGVPVVGSRVGGVPDLVRHGQDGLLVPPGNPVALGEACIALLRDRDRAMALGEAGRRRVASHFSYDTMLQRIEAVYEAVLDGSEQRAETARGPGLRLS